MSIVWYGERGIVNALVLALHEDGNKSTVAWSTFLRNIHWVDGSTWAYEIVSVTPIVEIGLAHFGNPDLLLVVSCTDGVTRCIFVEAKVGGYLSSAQSNATGMGKQGDLRGFNSSINGQLSLRYRFAHGLAVWDGTSTISEPSALLAQYGRKCGEGLDDYHQRPRSLAKKKVLSILANTGMQQVKVTDCFFVALTSDIESPFTNLDHSFRPLLLGLEGNSVWEQMGSSMGWIGYDVLRTNLELGAGFRDALASMGDLARPPRPLHPPQADAEVDAPDSNNGIPSIQTLFESLEALARESFRAVESRKVGISVKIGGKVRIKLVPEKDRLLLGVQDDQDPKAWWDANLDLRSIHGQRFWFMKLPVNERDAIEHTELVFQELQARHPDDV